MNKHKIANLKIADIVKLITKGTTPTSIGENFTDTGINYIKAESVTREGHIDKSKFAHISKVTHEKLKRSQIEEGDILFSMAGMVLGKTAVVTPDCLPANTNQALAIIRLNKLIANPKYVHYFMKQESFFNYVNSMSGQSAQPNINFEEIKSLEIILPQLQQQNKIVKILSDFDAKIELHNKMNLTLEQIAQAIFKHWFIDFEFPVALGKADASVVSEDGKIDEKALESILKSPGYRSSGGKMVKSEMGEIPEGWKVGKISDLGYIQPGYAFKSADFVESGIKIIKIRNIQNGVVNITDGDCVATSTYKFLDPKFVLSSGDFIIAMTGADLGKMGLVPKTENILLLNQRVGKIVSKYKNLLYLFMRQSDVYELMRGISSTSSAQGNISNKDLDNFEILVPTKNILMHLESNLAIMFKFMSNNLQQSQTLSQLRDLLLPRLMSGELKV